MNKFRYILESMNEAKSEPKKKSGKKWHQAIGRKLFGAGVGAHVAGEFVPGKAGKILRTAGGIGAGAGLGVGAGKLVGGYYHNEKNIKNDPGVSKAWKKQIAAQK